MSKESLDRIDKKILAALQKQGRLSNQELADKISLSPAPCLRRVRRLEERGYIRGYVALLDDQKLGLSLIAYVNVKLEKRAVARGGRFAFDDFRDAVMAWPEVVACYAMTGDSDYLMRVQAQDLAHFSDFVMKKLLKYPGVLDVRSSFALDRIKETTALPI
jgi:Lrp/AsnC family transcriptional regulator, leucine-responsive regulatory protein